MALGHLPFDNPENPVSMQEAILKGDILFPNTRKDPFLKDLCREILVKDPNQRPLWEDIKLHRYFHDIDWDNAALRRLDVPYKPNPMKY